MKHTSRCRRGPLMVMAAGDRGGRGSIPRDAAEVGLLQICDPVGAVKSQMILVPRESTLRAKSTTSPLLDFTYFRDFYDARVPNYFKTWNQLAKTGVVSVNMTQSNLNCALNMIDSIQRLRF